MDSHTLIVIAARASLLYFAWVFGLRLISRRSLGELAAFDLLLAVVMIEALDEVLAGTLVPWKGAFVVGSVVLWHLAHLFRARLGRSAAPEPLALAAERSGPHEAPEGLAVAAAPAEDWPAAGLGERDPR